MTGFLMIAEAICKYIIHPYLRRVGTTLQHPYCGEYVQVVSPSKIKHFRKSRK